MKILDAYLLATQAQKVFDVPGIMQRIGSGKWMPFSSTQVPFYWANSGRQVYGTWVLWTDGGIAYVTSVYHNDINSAYTVICAKKNGVVVHLGYYVGDRARMTGTCYTGRNVDTDFGLSWGIILPQNDSMFTAWGYPDDTEISDIVSDFFSHA